jgi:hypothetical protein
VDPGRRVAIGERDAADFPPLNTREKLRYYLVVLDMVNEFKADRIGWA